MRAICWEGRNRVAMREVPEPRILNPKDAVVKITLTAICGSDLHLYDGYIPTLRKGDILGHEFMGEVMEIGEGVRDLRVGDRIVVAFPIACGACFFCRRQMYALCDNSNPNGWLAEDLYGHAPAGIFGYSHLLGGYAGGQAEFARVPFADVGHVKIPEEMSDEQALFLSDIFPTGYMAAEHCGIQAGDTVAVWGCGPVGQFAIRSALLLGAQRVIAIDSVPERLQMAETVEAVETLDESEEDVLQGLKERTAGRGPDSCIDAVGMEAHGTGALAWYDRTNQAVLLETGRPHVLRQAIQACRKGGTISLAGVYGGFLDKVPMGAAFNKGLTLRMGQTHVQKYLRPLLERIRKGEIDPSFVITHRLPLEEAPAAYEIFKKKQDGCIKVVLRP